MANEKRLLIYYDDLIMTLAKQYGATMDTHIYSPRDILSSIQGLSYVDAVEVVHGRWIESTNTDYMMSQFTCSECGVKYIAKTWNYCPNCGADMRGSEE